MSSLAHELARRKAKFGCARRAAVRKEQQSVNGCGGGVTMDVGGWVMDREVPTEVSLPLFPSL